jgi:hypothetical protein
MDAIARNNYKAAVTRMGTRACLPAPNTGHRRALDAITINVGLLIAVGDQAHGKVDRLERLAAAGLAADGRHTGVRQYALDQGRGRSSRFFAIPLRLDECRLLIVVRHAAAGRAVWGGGSWAEPGAQARFQPLGNHKLLVWPRRSNLHGCAPARPMSQAGRAQLSLAVAPVPLQKGELHRRQAVIDVPRASSQQRAKSPAWVPRSPGASQRALRCRVRRNGRTSRLTTTKQAEGRRLTRSGSGRREA